MCGVSCNGLTRSLSCSTFIFASVWFLLPGSLSVATLQQAQSATGQSFGIKFLEVAVSIALGLLVGSVPRTRSFSKRRVDEDDGHEASDGVYIGTASLI